MQGICPKCGEIQPGQSLNVHLYRSTVTELYEAWIPMSHVRGQGKTPEEAITNLFKKEL